MRSRLIEVAALLAPLLIPAARLGAQVAVRGETVYTMAGAPIRDGVVLVRDGRIAEVGPASRVRVPDGWRVLTAKVVTPGLVDAHTVVGLSGALNVDTDQDQLDRTAPLLPDLRAYDAYNPRETLVGFVRSMGVTTMHTGHGPGALVSGQTMVVKTWGDALTPDNLLDSTAMLAMTLGPEVAQIYAQRGPGTRSRGLAMLREQFVKAQAYARTSRAPDSTQRPPRDLSLETLGRVLAGEVPAMITAHRATEILAALRLQREFGFRLVLDGAADAHLVLDEIRRANVPVILHPAMTRPGGPAENVSLETAAALRRAGVPFAFQSGYEAYVPKTRVLLWEAAIAAANGLTMEQALAAITIDAARLIGAERRVGSLERGKDGDLVLFDGDPFEYRSHVCGVVIEGRVVSEGCR